MLIWCCGSMSCVMCESDAVQSLSVLNCTFSKEQSTLPEDDRMIETCRSVLSVLM